MMMNGDERRGVTSYCPQTGQAGWLVDDLAPAETSSKTHSRAELDREYGVTGQNHRAPPSYRDTHDATPPACQSMIIR